MNELAQIKTKTTILFNFSFFTYSFPVLTLINIYIEKLKIINYSSCIVFLYVYIQLFASFQWFVY